MLFRLLRTETGFKFILLPIICFSCVSTNFSPHNFTTEPQEPETLYRRRWRRDGSERELCNPEKLRSIVTYPGESVVLKCSTCGNTNLQFSVWKVKLRGTKEPVKLSSLKREEVVREGSADLAITNVAPELGGIFTCLSSRTQGIYEIIIKTLPKFKVVYGEAPSEDTSGEVFTKWGSWTKCSAAKCGTPGERSRIGLCNYRVRRQMYADGVPCRSITVASSKREELKDVPDKKLIQSCQQKCSGVYSKSSSLSNKMPELPPMVTQKALYAKAGEPVALSCSGVSVVAYVRWEVDGTMIRQIDLQREGDKHMSIDVFHTLHINRLRDTDEGIYGCWHNDVMHHSYKLKIVKPPPDTEEAEGGALWVGIVLTFIVLAVIAIGVFKAWRMKRRVV